MPVESLPWDDLRLVLAIAESRGLGPAADRLGLNGSTVFRRLAQIEERLGLKLFDRHRSGYVATPAGAEIADTARRMDDDVAALGLRLAGHAALPSGTIRLTTNDTFLALLTPILARFRREHPAITLDLVVANEALNLSRRDADVAVRATMNPPETLVGRRTATIAWALYAAPGRTEGPDAEWVALGERFAGVPAAKLTRSRPGRIVYTLDTVLGLTEAVEAGIGIGYLPCFLADGRPGLERLTPPIPDLAGSLWLLTHPDLRGTPRIRVLLDALAAGLAAARPLLAGEGGGGLARVGP